MRRLLALLSAAFVRVLYATLRVEHIDSEKITQLPQYVIAFWHEHLVMMLHARYRRPIRVMVSRSRDGEYVAGAFAHYDVDVARGSTTRGGTAALRELIRAARSGSNIVFTPDGPKGPRRIVKEGIVMAARATGLPIMPVAFGAKKKKLMGSWDRMVVPHPFTQAIFIYGDPITISRDEDIEPSRLKIEKALNALSERAETYWQK